MVFSDKPARIDLFDFNPYVTGIADLVRQTKPDDLPVTIGIYGAWGSGKTSFIKQLEQQLQGDEKHKIPSVWFEAWKYDRTDDVRSALIYTILANLHTQTKGNKREEIKRGFEKVVAATKTLALDTQLSVSTPGASLVLPTIGHAIDNIDKAESYRVSVDDLANGFGEAVKAFVTQYPKDEQKLIIFVDDLDRCLPEHVITVLESLKLFLDRAPCIFIMAVDRTVVEKAVQNHYGADPGVSGRDYLDKIIQYAFTVPPVNPSKLKQHIGELAKATGINDTCLKIFDIASEGNPRIYSRLIASWNLTASLAPHVVPSFWTNGSIRHVLAIAIALHSRWPVLREVSINNPTGLILFTEYCINPPSIEIDKALAKNHASEYLPFWTNGSIRSFLYSLQQRKVGENTGQIFGSVEHIRTALELCSRNI